MSKSTISKEAKLDLKEIWLDIIEITKSEEFSDNFIDSFFETFKTIFKNPGIGESRKELRINLRKWTHRKYIIYYTDHEDYVQIKESSGEEGNNAYELHFRPHRQTTDSKQNTTKFCF